MSDGKLKTIDCSECGKPVAYTFTDAEIYGHIRCQTCLYMVIYVANKLGVEIENSIFDIKNNDNEDINTITKRQNIWKRNLWSSFKKEIVDET